MNMIMDIYIYIHIHSQVSDLFLSSGTAKRLGTTGNTWQQSVSSEVSYTPESFVRHQQCRWSVGCVTDYDLLLRSLSLEVSATVCVKISRLHRWLSGLRNTLVCTQLALTSISNYCYLNKSTSEDKVGNSNRIIHIFLCTIFFVADLLLQAKVG